MTIYSLSSLSCFEKHPQKFKLQHIDKVKTPQEGSTAPTRFELVTRDPESLMLTTTPRGYTSFLI
jgi:hypothetical protein